MPRLLALADIQQFAAINVLSDPGYDPGNRIIPNCALVRLNWSLSNGRVAHNILYASWSGSPALSTTLAQAMFAAMSTGATWSAHAGFLAASTSFTGVTLLDIRSTAGLEFNSTGLAVPGTSVSAAIPDESSFVITFRTAQRGPQGRGRMYLPGYATNALGTGGVVAAGAVTASLNWVISACGVISSQLGTQSLGLYKRKEYTSPITGRFFPARNAHTEPVTAQQAKDNHWDSQRRRGLK